MDILKFLRKIINVTKQCSLSKLSPTEVVSKGYINLGKFVEALRYKPEGFGFDSRRSHWNFSLT